MPQKKPETRPEIATAATEDRAPPPRLARGGQLIIASHNPGKIAEFVDLLAPWGMQVRGAADFTAEAPEEIGATFAANARLKADIAARLGGGPALGDDSGLNVAGLGGAPGIYSARWAEVEEGPQGGRHGGRDFFRAMERVHQALGGHPDRRAAFVCALVLVMPDGRSARFTGRVEGEVVWPPRGENGFAYDPFFRPNGYESTFGEMDGSAKQQLSHRAAAFAHFAAACLPPLDGA